MPSLLERIGLSTGRRSTHLAERLEAADRRAAELKQALNESKEETQRWKRKATELTQQLERHEKAAERLPHVERELARAKERIEHLVSLKEALAKAERTIAISREHLVATESKLDVIEGAITVLDRRTRT
jgi:chromosome segregation ATPase